MAILTQMQPYQWVQNSGEGYIVLPKLSHPGVFHFFGTRFLSDPGTVQTGPERIASMIRLRQVHGDRICPVPEEAPEMKSPSEEVWAGDALVTHRPYELITVRTADCVPVLLYDPIRRVVSATHAGWRGTVLNIAGKAVQEMTVRYGSDPNLLLAGIGPCIGPCCYEVGKEVWGEVERKFAPGADVVFHEGDGKAKLDLARLNALQLIQAGLQADKIAFSGLCTACLPGLFYSYRRDGKKMGNMISGIMLAEA
ncbi:MAG: peptidoglycan editing factor PgeF [Nitrospirae bacterium]|nr:peptidoglycan editing factor PgeF [Candidatus Manganitrophaceae bacterium]